MKNTLLSLILFGSTVLSGQTDKEQSFAEELGPQVDRVLALMNCSGDVNDLIFNRVVFQPNYSPEFLERTQEDGVTSSFFQQYAYIGKLPADGRIEYQSIAQPYQLVLMDDANNFTAFHQIDFSANETTTEVCVDRYWYKTNPTLYVDQLLDGEVEEINIRVYRSNPTIDQVLENVQDWIISNSDSQFLLTIREEEETIQESVVNKAFLQELKNLEGRVRLFTEHRHRSKKAGAVESFTFGTSNSFMHFSTRKTTAFELEKLIALLELL